MIKFRHLREKMLKGMPPGEHVYDKKISGVTLMIHKEKGKFELNERIKNKLKYFP